MVGAALGYRVALVMPANVSAARKQITAAYGTELIFSSELEGSDGAIRLVRAAGRRRTPSKLLLPRSVFERRPTRARTTSAPGARSWEQTGGRVTHFVAGIGTSGTIMGTGRRLKEHDRRVQIVAVEPDDALHGLEGLKHLAVVARAGDLAPRGHASIGVMPHAAPTRRGTWPSELAHEEGLFVGHSAGAAVAGALRVARELPAGERACIVTLLPDRGDRYFTPLKWEKHYEW